MWMISNFPVKRHPIAVLVACLAFGGFLFGCRTSTVSQIPPDAPRSRLPVDEQNPPALDYSQQMIPMELKSVSVHRLDSTLAKFAGPAFIKTASDPFAIEVQTQKPLGNLARTSSPVIILNGDKFTDTWAIGKDKLVAFLPDLKRIKDTNTVAAVWLGNEELTMTRSPLIFRAEDVKR
jgi:hypothetical protein